MFGAKISTPRVALKQSEHGLNRSRASAARVAKDTARPAAASTAALNAGVVTFCRPRNAWIAPISALLQVKFPTHSYMRAPGILRLRERAAHRPARTLKLPATACQLSKVSGLRRMLAGLVPVVERQPGDRGAPQISSQRLKLPEERCEIVTAGLTRAVTQAFLFCGEVQDINSPDPLPPCLWLRLYEALSVRKYSSGMHLSVVRVRACALVE